MTEAKRDENPYAAPHEPGLQDALPTAKRRNYLRVFLWTHVVVTASPFLCAAFLAPWHIVGRPSPIPELFAFVSFLSIPICIGIALWLLARGEPEQVGKQLALVVIEFLLICIQVGILLPLVQ
jgi:hypothetical protein